MKRGLDAMPLFLLDDLLSLIYLGYGNTGCEVFKEREFKIRKVFG
jgi:hypothetical protein